MAFFLLYLFRFISPETRKTCDIGKRREASTIMIDASIFIQKILRARCIPPKCLTMTLLPYYSTDGRIPNSDDFSPTPNLVIL